MTVFEAQKTQAQQVFNNRFEPAWPVYSDRLTLMGLPGEIRNLIVRHLLPVDMDGRPLGDENRIISRRRSGPFRRRLVRRLLRRSRPVDYRIPAILRDIGIGSRIPAFVCTCRQLRYEYGAAVCAANEFHFRFLHPGDWPLEYLKRFRLFAASVGVSDILNSVLQLYTHMYVEDS